MLIVDDSDLNADWIKTGTWDLPTDPAALEATFGPDWYATLSRLPAWRAAPPEVKAARPVTMVKFAPGLRPVLKHGDPSRPGYAQMHPTGAGSEYAEWGDHAERIRLAESRGPSADALKDAITSSDDRPDLDEMQAWILENQPDAVDVYIDNDYSFYQQRTKIEAMEPGEDRDSAANELLSQAAYNLSADDEDYWLRMMRDEQPSPLGDEDEARSLMNEVYGFTHEGKTPDGRSVTMTADVEGVEVGYGQVVVRGSITGGRGEHAGQFQRRFFVKDGELIVEHELLELEPEYRGSGFATEFNANAEDYYISRGFREIRVHAALENGGYTWARAGYDFTDGPRHELDGSRDNIKARIDRYIEAANAGQGSAGTVPRLSGAQQRSLLNIAERLDLDRDDPDFPTPFEVTEAGRTAGAQTWPGREIMVGSNWFGVKPLRPGPARRSATQQQQEADRQQIPGQLELGETT